MAENLQPVEFIRKVRDGRGMAASEVEAFAKGILTGEVTDSQVAAWTMAVYFQGMEPEALFALTEAMAHSGEFLDLSPIEGVVVDKHSTGGVGDKTTMVVAPLVASFGVPVVKLSGRALGHSGGTVDKLESIPGFRSQLTEEEVIAQGRELGLVLAGHSQNIAPLDAKIYQIRDRCATVESIPLIASSIISKKLAGGAAAFVFDVKVGPGAFMETIEEARQLAHFLTELAQRAGRGVAVLYSSMAEPLGSAIGNALEVREALAALEGKGPQDLVALCVALARKMLQLAGVEAKEEELLARLVSGQARNCFEKMVSRQGGRLEELPQASHSEPVLAPRAGFVQNWDPRQLGIIARTLGGWEKPDPAAGIEILAKRGAWVEQSTPVAMIHAGNREELKRARAALLQCLQLGSQMPCEIPLLFS